MLRDESLGESGRGFKHWSWHRAGSIIPETDEEETDSVGPLMKSSASAYMDPRNPLSLNPQYLARQIDLALGMPGALAATAVAKSTDLNALLKKYKLFTPVEASRSDVRVFLTEDSPYRVYLWKFDIATTWSQMDRENYGVCCPSWWPNRLATRGIPFYVLSRGAVGSRDMTWVITGPMFNWLCVTRSLTASDVAAVSHAAVEMLETTGILVGMGTQTYVVSMTVKLKTGEEERWRWTMTTPYPPRIERE